MAAGITGSVGREADAENSDIDFNVLVKQAGRIPTHRLVLRGGLFSVAARLKETG
ncbi:MAG: hypothetical protein JRN59_08505 [Nitrososphaerota archaeon]|nr:hypothetical protein [Nitrososphaerota archaeon]